MDQIALGMCHADTVISENCGFHHNNKKKEAYLIKSTGENYSALQHTDQKSFKFGKNDIIHVTYDLYNSELIFMKAKVFSFLI